MDSPSSQIDLGLEGSLPSSPIWDSSDLGSQGFQGSHLLIWGSRNLGIKRDPSGILSGTPALQDYGTPGLRDSRNPGLESGTWVRGTWVWDLGLNERDPPYTSYHSYSRYNFSSISQGRNKNGWRSYPPVTSSFYSQLCRNMRYRWSFNTTKYISVAPSRWIQENSLPNLRNTRNTQYATKTYRRRTDLYILVLDLRAGGPRGVDQRVKKYWTAFEYTGKCGT